MDTTRKQLHLPTKMRKEIELLAVQDEFSRANDLYIKLLQMGLIKYKKSKEEKGMSDNKLTIKELLDLILENEDEIMEALEKVYEAAVTSQSKQFKTIHTAILHENGKISFGQETQDQTDGDVWNNKAIYLGYLEDFVPWDNDDEFGNWIKQALTDEERGQYENWLTENDGENEDIYGSGFNALKEWNQKVHDRVAGESLAVYISDWRNEWATQKYDALVEEYTKYAHAHL